MTISRRAILGFLGSAGTVAVLSKLSPVLAEPEPVYALRETLSEPIVSSSSGDLYFNMHRATLFFKRDGSDKWESVGDVRDFRIEGPGTIECGMQDPGESVWQGEMTFSDLPEDARYVQAAFPPVIKRGGDHV